MEDIGHNTTSPKFWEADDLIVAKVVSMCVLGVVSFIIGLLPIKLTKLISIKSVNGDKNLLVSLLLCFGGGVLLFTTFIHLQPEVRTAFQHLEAEHAVPDIGVPMSELVFCIGFFFVYFIEEAVHCCLDSRTHNTELHRTLSMRCSSRKNKLTIPRVTLNKFDDGNLSYISTSNKELLNSMSSVSIEKSGHSHHVMDDELQNSFSGFLAVLALSFHAVFEGLAVGLEASVQKVWYLFAAIATHKFVIAFCVGTELATSKTKTLLVLLYMGTFAVVSPLGIGIGLILSDGENNAENLISTILQGMAAGTLLYVVFFEVLSRERGNSHRGIWQLMAIIMGFALMFGLQFISGHDHSHGPEGHSHQHNNDHTGHHHHSFVGAEDHNHTY
ncbi:zinc transporter ZIP1-like [Aethina tumida]|uniref:zinc transporter ZIP1-like n=1 Tax=Aethina tumida TaxID=116153 RepID=UPI00096B4177|nr:zinc transporter ZIP1-like [Aethina tumida]